MTNELKNKVETELKRAYAYFGEYDEELMNETATEEVTTLACMTASVAPESFEVEGEVLVGYPITVALTPYNPEKVETVVRNGKTHTHERVTAVELVVTKTELVYVLYAYDVYKPENWTGGDNFEVAGQTYKKVSLEDIDVELFFNN